MKKQRTRRTAAQWHQLVEAQQASGLSAPSFCKEKQISYPSFINWKKKLSTSATDQESDVPAFIELTPTPTERSVTPESKLLVELDLGPGIQLRIHSVC